MAGFVEGRDRNQATLLPDRLDEALGEDHPVCVVDALEHKKLGFIFEVEATGRPGHHPATILKIYLYGDLNQIQSSRHLGRECGRNIELMWLTDQFAPGFRSIADFQSRSSPSVVIVLCRE